MNHLQGDISGFILAGGKSSRMGSDKGLIEFAGRRMVEHSILALKPLCSSIQIVTNNSDYCDLGYSVHQDLIEDKGPLAGICTALSLSKTRLNLIITCDSPFVTSALLSHLIEQSEGVDAVVPLFNNRVYPLTAVYATSCYTALNKRLIENELKVKDALNFIHTKQIELTENLPFFNEKILANINTLKELEIHEN
tara:strand:+ start:197 stop:781 length:585 start_codon:yes stop_codon:yes gene_type:complete